MNYFDKSRVWSTTHPLNVNDLATLIFIWLYGLISRLSMFMKAGIPLAYIYVRGGYIFNPCYNGYIIDCKFTKLSEKLKSKNL